MVDLADHDPGGIDEEEGGYGVHAVEGGDEGVAALFSALVDYVEPGECVVGDGLLPGIGIGVDGDAEYFKTFVVVL